VGERSSGYLTIGGWTVAPRGSRTVGADARTRSLAGSRCRPPREPARGEECSWKLSFPARRRRQRAKRLDRDVIALALALGPQGRGAEVHADGDGDGAWLRERGICKAEHLGWVAVPKSPAAMQGQPARVCILAASPSGPAPRRRGRQTRAFDRGPPPARFSPPARRCPSVPCTIPRILQRSSALRSSRPRGRRPCL
jgi:hypothetical protein